MVRRSLLIASAVLIGLALALLVAEFVERMLDSSPAPADIKKGRYRLASNPGVGFEPIPNRSRGKDEKDFMDYDETANSLGFRDYEHAVDAPEVYRILVLGDSVASGHHIKRYQDAFPFQLEKLLNDRGHVVEVINFGVSGYNTQQEVEILKDRGLQFSPDLVLLAYCLNDRERSDGGILKSLATAKRAQGVVWSETGTWLDHSRLYQFLAYRYRAGQEIPSAYQKLFEDTVAEYFAELATLSKAERHETLIAILPDFDDLKSGDMPEEYGEIAALAAQHSLPSLNLLTTVRACRRAGQRRLKRDHYHPSEAGHRCIAQGLADTVENLMTNRL